MKSDSPRHVLLVEDGKELAETLGMEFAEVGWSVTVAHSMKELKATAPADVGHAVVDLRLGADSGLDAVAHIRATYPQARIVILTGYGSIVTAVKAVKGGADDYLTKPVSFPMLMDVLLGMEEPPGNEGKTVESLHDHERDFVESVLLQCGGNVSAAARRLGIHRQSLQRKLRKFSG
jgi:two-component system response regulator RegA